MTIEELFGTLQQSVVGAWRKHLRTSKYSKHMALDEFYTEMPEKVDALIEAWMGVNGKKPKQFDNILKSKNMNTLDYLKSLKKVVKDGYELMDGEKELEALLDDIAELIDSTLYKVKELNENKTKKHMKNLKEFLNESLVNEASNTDINKALLNIGRISNEDEYLVSQCYDWLEKSGWVERDEDQLFDLIKNLDKKGLDKRTLDLIKELNKPGFDRRSFDDNYLRCMNAMVTAGKSNVDKWLVDIGHWE